VTGFYSILLLFLSFWFFFCFFFREDRYTKACTLPRFFFIFPFVSGPPRSFFVFFLRSSFRLEKSQRTVPALLDTALVLASRRLFFLHSRHDECTNRTKGTSNSLRKDFVKVFIVVLVACFHLIVHIYLLVLRFQSRLPWLIAFRMPLSWSQNPGLPTQ